jgi:hypothetical protein
MNANPAKLDPLLSDFETQEEADSYDRWFRAKVQKSLDTDRALFIPHEEVIAEMEAEGISRAAWYKRGNRRFA